MEITSLNNDLVKETVKLQQKKYRAETGKFLLEGYKTIKEAYDYGIKIEKVFVNSNSLADYEFLSAQNLVITNDKVLKKISTTDTPPNAIAIGYQREYSFSEISKMHKIVLLEGIKDSGNLGTIIRSAVAFFADGIILYGDCIDLYNPKCVRASVGNLWKLPIYHIKDFKTLEKYFKEFEKVATLPRAKHLLKDFIPKKNCMIMFGSEADGLSQELINFSNSSVKIEMSQHVESLNLSVSASVIMYELWTKN